MRLRFLGWILVLCCVLGAAAPAAPKLGRVRPSADGRGFVRGGRPFRPWGANYGNAGRLIEDYWEREWPTVAADFRELKELGYSVVRVHLQLGRLMAAADRPDPRALERLERLLRLAEEVGLYLDLTGLGCYRTAEVPAWYDPLSEAERWEVQARFWSAVARACAARPVVFCYDLMNEPLSPASRREPGRWYSGSTFGGYDFLQFIALDPAGRSRPEIARQWIRRLTAAIRAHDRETPITVGLLPSTRRLGHFSGFLPEQVAPELDFLSVHVYPEAGKVVEAVEMLKGFAVGKPLVVEETFPLSCSAAELESFLRQSRGIASGWLGHYDGRTAAEYRERQRAGTLTPGEAIWLSWLELSQRLGSELTAPERGGS